MSRLGDLIKLERTRRNLTPKAVAKKSGISERYLLEVEAGSRIIQDVQARRILKVMGAQAPEETGFTFDDIASTVDLQSGLQQAAPRPTVKESGKQAKEPEDVNITGSIWVDALAGVLKHVPIYNAVMKEVGSRLLPVTEGKIEGANKDSVYYFKAPDDQMRGFRIHRGDLVLMVPASAPQDDALMLVETAQGRLLRQIKLLPRFQAMLQWYDQAFESEIVNISDLKVVGKGVRLEAELT